MADEKPDDQNVDENADQTPVEAVEASEAPVADETPAADEASAPEETAPAGDEPAPEEPVAEEPAPEPAADEPAVEAEPEEKLHPKDVRRRARRQHTGDARPQRSAEERQSERKALRADKAKRRSVYRVKARAKAAKRRAEHPAAPAPQAEPATGQAKVRQGIVVSDKADKTITVRVDISRRHRRYEKIVRSSSTLHAHDESNDANAGDIVRVIESRPLSRTKRWRLVEVVERAK